MFFYLFLALCSALGHPFSTPISKENLFSYIGSVKHVILHFYAPDCPHCEELAPEWNEVTRIYRPNDNIVFAVVNCDRWRSICSSLDGSATPTIQYFPPRERRGVAYGGSHDVISIVKWIKANTGIMPFTKPGSMVYTTPKELKYLTESKSVFLAIDDSKSHFYNQTEIRQAESLVSSEFRALSPSDYPKESSQYCSDIPCLVFLQGDKKTLYNGPVNHTAVASFVEILLASPDL